MKACEVTNNDDSLMIQNSLLYDSVSLESRIQIPSANLLKTHVGVCFSDLDLKGTDFSPYLSDMLAVKHENTKIT